MVAAYIVLVVVILAGILFLGLRIGYTRGYTDGVQSGSWESVLARATRINKRTFGKGNQL
ncbi:hypothetical protein LCGC14_1637100 [marine sediment metagenome]|uniref:Uncharacterized protein n=1 Tax=marine sediment metagenome TaxID=412755 RepID=A0A0F9I0S6_9ZZZZ